MCLFAAGTAAAIAAGTGMTAGAATSANLALAGLAISGASTAYGVYNSSQNSAAQEAYQDEQARWQQEKYEAEVKAREEEAAFRQYQYEQEMKYRQEQFDFQMRSYEDDISFQQEQWDWQMDNYERDLLYEHEQDMANMDYARRTMEAAGNAAEIDYDMLDQEEEQAIASAGLDDFERRRQALRESAKIRVAQGESGLFGNTALKELVNSKMQESYDRGIINYNLKNEKTQIQAKRKKVSTTAKSRINEALSGIPRNFSMNPAMAGLAIQ